MISKLLFLDLDGTAILPGTFDMLPSTRKALREARKNGHRAIVCTGRNMGAVRPILKYGFDGIIASAGGYIQIGDAVLRDNPIPDEDVRLAFRLLRENGVCVQPETFEKMYIDEALYALLGKVSVSAGNSELVRMRKQADDRLHSLPLRDYHGQTVYKILFACEDASQLAEPERALGERYFFLKHPKDQNGILYGELIYRENSKGKAVERVMDYFQKGKEDAIAFGDSMNDWEMFRACGFRVCMGGGADDLKRIADYVCPEQKADGLYQAFVQMGLTP